MSYDFEEYQEDSKDCCCKWCEAKRLSDKAKAQRRALGLPEKKKPHEGL